jgi:hypothetical protein
LPTGASLRQIAPESVDESTIERFIAELETSTLARDLPQQRRRKIKIWNIEQRSAG